LDGLTVLTLIEVSPFCTNGRRLYSSSSHRGGPPAQGWGGAAGSAGFAVLSPMPPTEMSSPSPQLTKSCGLSFLQTESSLPPADEVSVFPSTVMTLYWPVAGGPW